MRGVLMMFGGVLLLGRSLLAQPVPAPTSAPDTCLMFAASNIGDGKANFYIYAAISTKRIDLRQGDALEYDIRLSPANPTAGGGVDIETDKASLRDSGSADQNQLNAHPNAELKDAVGQWYHRRILLDKLAGQQTRRFNLVFEGDKPGNYAQFIDDVAIVHPDGKRDVIYSAGEAMKNGRISREGYSKVVVLKPIARESVIDGPELTKVIDREMAKLRLGQELDDLRAQVEFIHKFADKNGDAHLAEHATEAAQLLEKARKDESLDAEAVQALIHQVHESLNHEHPEMRKYTGHLVGHAHIDFQWLWEWPETIKVCKDTFGQALRFMDEFPGFKFSQSSSALYATTEENHPEIFEGIRKQVAAGNWEIVGGRVCEGDEHMISPESHARHFLYGQRYFRERFDGKQAQVGWEPDTFGHTWQMPQILRLGGCKYFYFCRGGGKDVPLFWWQAPDGSKVLAFDEPATGGWYNGDVAMKNFDRLLDFAGTTGSKDMLWVYGVGNHGGGPTRENIRTALGFQQVPMLPNVKFSTATEFFHQLETYDLGKIPTVSGELNSKSNGGFYGTYTSHSDIKRWNRDAEATTESAEAIAAVASRYGFNYPGKEFRRNWEDITWNHHHDTLPGTSIHPSYNKSETMFARVIESSRGIGNEALAFIGSKVRSEGDGVLVFNSVARKQSGVVEFTFGGDRNPIGKFVTDGTSQFQVAQTAEGKAMFFARDLPPLGYRLYKYSDVQVKKSPDVSVSQDFTTLQNAEYRMVIDPSRGVITSIYDKQATRESIAPGGSGNRLEIHWEDPNGMSAWVIGKINKVEPLVGPVELKPIELGDARVTISWDRKFGSSTLHQTVSLPAHGPPEFGFATEWKELGTRDKPAPFLKAAFDLAGDSPKLVSQIPFGTIERPADGAEVPALKWSALAGAGGGAALLNDCKHGYSAEGNTIRLSLIRSTYHPDAHPNDRPQSARWSLLPFSGPLQASSIIAAAEAFNHPLWQTMVKPNPMGQLPSQASLVSMPAENVIITGIKQAEDNGDLIVRFYEADGKTTAVQPKLALDSARVQTVNFMEDLINDADPDAALRPYEIRTLKIRTSPAK